MKKFAFISASLTLPFLAFAQSINSIQSAGQFIITLINTVAVPVIFAIAFIVFIWGVFQYFVLSGGNEEKQADARNLMIYGIVGLFVMASVWGLVNILIGTFNFNSNTPNYPQAQYQH